jgi:hypothetical protein
MICKIGHTNLDTLTFVTVSKNIKNIREKYSLLYLDKDEDPLMESNKDVILVLNNAPSIYPGNYFNSSYFI